MLGSAYSSYFSSALGITPVGAGETSWCRVQPVPPTHTMSALEGCLLVACGGFESRCLYLHNPDREWKLQPLSTPAVPTWHPLRLEVFLGCGRKCMTSTNMSTCILVSTYLTFSIWVGMGHLDLGFLCARQTYLLCYCSGPLLGWFYWTTHGNAQGATLWCVRGSVRPERELGSLA